MMTTEAKAISAPEVSPSEDQPPVPRDERGRFPKGTSGNPAGRLKGTKNKITLERLLLEEQLRGTLTNTGPRLLKKAIRMALGGNDKVMRVLLDKMITSPRGESEDTAVDREIKITIENHTGPKPLPPIEGEVVRVDTNHQPSKVRK